MQPHGLILGEEHHDLGTIRQIRSPFDGRVVGEVAFGDAGIMEQAVGLATEKFAALGHVPAHRRSHWLKGIASGIQRQADELGRTISEEAGKPITLARSEVARAVGTFTIAAEEALRIRGELLPFDRAPDGEGRTGMVRRVPIGPVAAISPFNFPLNLVAHKLAAALAAGNTAVLKPASQTPMSAIELGRIILEAGVPPGMVNVIPCAATDAAPLVEDDRIRMLTFTGSAEVGWALKARSGRKKVTLELGGNAAAIVEPDCDIEDAARKLALGAFIYAGQICISVQRIYVHDRAARRFYKTFLEVAKSYLTCGDPADPEVLCGPMIDSGNADRVLEWVDQARSAEATVLLEPRRDGNVVSPAVLSQVPPELPIVAREAFGPVVVVETYRGINGAIQRVNDSAYGLQAAIYSNDLRKVMRAYDRIEVGAVIHNDYPTYRIDPMPYGGVKESGQGREGPRYAIEEMTEPRMLVLYPEKL